MEVQMKKEIGEMATLWLSDHHQVQGKVVALLLGGVVVLDQLRPDGCNYHGVPV